MRLFTAFLLALFVHGCLLFVALPPGRTVPPSLPAADQVTVTLVPAAASPSREKAAGSNHRQAAEERRQPAARVAEAPAESRPVPVTGTPARQAPVPARKPAQDRVVRPRRVKKRGRRQEKTVPSAGPAAARLPAARPAAAPHPAASPAPLPGRDQAAATATAAGVRQARPLYRFNPPPDYPALARRRAWQGVVLVRALVRADGRVATVALAKSSGHGLLDRSALAAVRGWRFVPGTRGGRPVATEVVVPIHFELK